MTDNISAEIVTIGTEILLGEITDSNSAYLAQILRDLGINVYYMSSVGDNERRIAEAIRLALSRATLVITSGGLGPTVDDMTRQGVALATDRPLEFRQELYDQIAERFRSFQSRMPENNRIQAYVPQGALAIHNPVGTAPSFIVELPDGQAVMSLPGVPRELKYLMRESIVPYLLSKYRLGVIKARNLRAAGIGESALDELLGRDLLTMSNPTIGLAAHHGVIDVRLTAKADSLPEAEAMLDAIDAQVRQRIGRYIFGVGQDRLEDAVLRVLEARSADLLVIQAGIKTAVARQIQAMKAPSRLSLLEFETPQNLAEVLDQSAHDLKGLALAAVRHYRQERGVLACVAFVSLPDVDENADVETASAVAVSADSEEQVRGYGFGALSDLASTWVSRWGLAWAWRILREGL
ncbi:MAG: molybdopterin-binding protein [Anaerolineae bacterium]|nr:molybdopterin-binding protein [Anaerolineae bacterium]MDW8171376.1 molybdopterin-binding protein [Anaerolineae bacterium]